MTPLKQQSTDTIFKKKAAADCRNVDYCNIITFFLLKTVSVVRLFAVI